MTNNLKAAFAFAVCCMPASVPAQGPVYRASTEPVADPALATLPGGAMLAIPGLLPDFVIGGGGQLVELPDGTARLTGRAISASSLYSAFLVDIVFSGRVAPGSPGHPPPGRPDLQLLPSAYAPSGPVDPAQFVYYTQASGTLVGSSNFAGALIDLQLTGGAVQYGAGANNRSGGLGLQGSFAVTVVQQPATPFGALTTADLVVDLPAERTDAVTHPQADPQLTTLPFGRAMSIPWVADDYVFAPAGEFTERDDGTALLEGRLLRLDQLDDAWDLTLTLGGRVDPGEPGFPPAGSPVRLMQPAAYAQSGGPIDPGHWHYYTSATGTLTGVDYNDGASITLQQSSAVQYGGGANQTNSFYGLYGALQPTVISHPIGRTLVIGGDVTLFGLCQVFPELPFPALTPPQTPYVLPTLTDQGFVLEGDNLAWAELVGIGATLLGPGDASDWLTGYYELIDNQHIEVHARPGETPGVYDVSVFTASWRSNILSVQLDAPASPALFSERAVPPAGVLHFLVHQGAIPGAALSAVAMSDSLAPTSFPGIVDLGIGNQQTALTIIPGSFLHDPGNGIARWDFGPIPSWYTGFVMHFQAVTIELSNVTLPLPTTNVWSVTF